MLGTEKYIIITNKYTRILFCMIDDDDDDGNVDPGFDFLIQI